MSWCETECKICAIGEQNEVFILGGQRIERRDGGRGEEGGLRKGAER